MAPLFLKTSLDTSSVAKQGNILVVIQLSGGNDGLNTIVPYKDDLYYQARPRLHIPASTVINIDEHLGFHPALKPLRDVYEQGEMCIVNAVGYPNPNRSHFRSMDIWQTGSDADKYLPSGWLGRYLDSNCTGCNIPYHAIELGDNLSLALQGGVRDGFAMRDAEKLVKATENRFLKKLGQSYVPDPKHDHLNYLYKTMVEVQESAQYIAEKAKSGQSKSNYPQHAFGRGLQQIGELILAETATQVYYISLPGFDTHVNQASRHSRLLKIYAESVTAFIGDLKRNRIFDNVCIMTFSEFGRRVAQNGSGGTDHGAANTLFLMGGSLKRAGIYNRPPNLQDLDQGDLKFEVDFRHVYANILKEWLHADPLAILGLESGSFDFDVI